MALAAPQRADRAAGDLVCADARRAPPP